MHCDVTYLSNDVVLPRPVPSAAPSGSTSCRGPAARRRGRWTTQWCRRSITRSARRQRGPPCRPPGDPAAANWLRQERDPGPALGPFQPGSARVAAPRREGAMNPDDTFARILAWLRAAALDDARRTAGASPRLLDRGRAEDVAGLQRGVAPPGGHERHERALPRSGRSAPGLEPRRPRCWLRQAGKRSIADRATHARRARAREAEPVIGSADRTGAREPALRRWNTIPTATGRTVLARPRAEARLVPMPEATEIP